MHSGSRSSVMALSPPHTLGSKIAMAKTTHGAQAAPAVHPTIQREPEWAASESYWLNSHHMGPSSRPAEGIAVDKNGHSLTARCNSIAPRHQPESVLMDPRKALLDVGTELFQGPTSHLYLNTTGVFTCPIHLTTRLGCRRQH